MSFISNIYLKTYAWPGANHLPYLEAGKGWGNKQGTRLQKPRFHKLSAEPCTHRREDVKTMMIICLMWSWFVFTDCHYPTSNTGHRQGSWSSVHDGKLFHFTESSCSIFSTVYPCLILKYLFISWMLYTLYLVNHLSLHKQTNKLTFLQLAILCL